MRIASTIPGIKIRQSAEPFPRIAIARRAATAHQVMKVLMALLLAGSTSAMAMNQEGHDGDWMTDFPPGLQLLEAIPEARPLPSRKCPVTSAMLANNPYEQIQLPRHQCRPGMAIKVQPKATVSAQDF